MCDCKKDGFVYLDSKEYDLLIDLYSATAAMNVLETPPFVYEAFHAVKRYFEG